MFLCVYWLLPAAMHACISVLVTKISLSFLSSNLFLYQSSSTFVQQYSHESVTNRQTNSRVSVFFTKLLRNDCTDFYEILCAYRVDLKIGQYFIPLNDKGDPRLNIIIFCHFFIYNNVYLMIC